MISFYFSDHQLLIAEGKQGSPDNWAVMDAGRFMLGNEVTDRSGFREELTNILRDKGMTSHDITLVLNSNQVISRLLQIPTRDDEHNLAYIANEFADVERNEAPVVGYTVLSEDKKTKLSQVVAYLADRGLIRKLQQLFSECGLAPDAIKPSLSCILHALQSERTSGSCVVEMMEPAGLTNLLLVEGKYTYSGFSRIQNEHGTPELGVEVARSVSNIIQFAQAQHLEDEVNAVLLAGFADAEREYAAEAIEAMLPGIHAMKPEQISGRGFDACFPAAVGLYDSRREENFRILSEVTKTKKKLGTAAKVAFAFLALALVLGAVAGVQLHLRRKQASALAALTAYNTDPALQAQLSYESVLATENAALRERVNAQQATKDALATYPVPDSTVIDRLNACADGMATVQIMKQENSTGQITVSATAPEVSQIHAFISLLRRESLFQVLEYSGYERLTNGEAWSISVILAMNRPTESGE